MSTPSPNSLRKFAEIADRIEYLKRISTISQTSNNDIGELYSPRSIGELTKQIENLNQTKAIYQKLAQYHKAENYCKGINSIISSFNLYPTKTFETWLKTIHYSPSVENSLAKDWHKVGSDLWKSYFFVSNKYSSNDHEQSK